jgi:hypothetical protein
MVEIKHTPLRHTRRTSAPTERRSVHRVSGDAFSPARFRAVYFDLDGTLLDSNAQVPTATLQTLAVLRKKGIKLGVATGRMLRSAARYAAHIGSNAPIIIYNGARVVDLDHESLLFGSTLDTPVARFALRTARHHRVHINVYIEDELFVENLDTHGHRFMTKERLQPNHVPDLMDKLSTAPVKMLMMGAPAVLRTCQSTIRNRFANQVSLVFSEADYLEVLPAGVSKGTALAHACRTMAIEPRHVVAFGDGENDAAMLQAAGWGVAMANARPEAKAAAHHVTGSNVDGGVVDALKQAFSEVLATAPEKNSRAEKRNARDGRNRRSGEQR